MPYSHTKLFSGSPEYQRPFSWNAEHFDDLIDDLIEADRKQQYFLGTIVLHNVDDKGNFDIVDGQQRMTSLMILLACLRDSIESKEYKDPIQQKIQQPENKVDGIPAQLRLEVREKKLFNDLIVSIGGTNNLPKISDVPDPEWRYVEAIEIFKERLGKLAEGQIQELISFVSQQCVVVKLSTTSFADAFRLFTIVNDRGKQLRRIDVLKAHNLAPDIISKDSVRVSYANKWADYENEMGSDLFESLFHLIRLIYLKDKPQGDLLSEFTTRIFGKYINQGEEFFNSVFEYCDLFERVFIDRDVLKDHEHNIKYNNFST